MVRTACFASLLLASGLMAACGTEAPEPSCSDLPTLEQRRACRSAVPDPPAETGDRCGDGIVGEWTPSRSFFDFDNGALPSAFDGEWIVRTDIDTSSPAATHAPLNDSENAGMSWAVTTLVPSTLSFDRRVSSEPNFDYLRFSIDGEVVDQWAGEFSWAEVSFEIPPGDHIFEWRYSKDGSVSRGEDAAWVDNVFLEANASFVEECDDANTADGDGCSAQCEIEEL